MPSKSREQHEMMVMAANNPKFAKKAGIDQDVAKEFVEKDKEAGLYQSGKKKEKK